MSTDRIHRLLRLIMLLQGGPPKGVDELAETLGVSRRTLFRYLNLLESVEIPFFHEPGVGYRLASNFSLTPVSLNVSETLGLMLLAKASSCYRGQPLTGAALSAISKLLATVPEPTHTACTSILQTVSVNPGPQPVNVKESQSYPTLQRCVDEQTACDLTYQSATDNADQHLTFEPYALHFSTRSWYVLGRSQQHDEVRILKLGRIKKVEPTESLFHRPDGFKVTDKIGNAWEMIPDGGEQTIVLKFSPRMARNVCEVRWHPSQQHQHHDDGSATVTFTIDGLSEIAWWVCGYADHVQVIEPDELRQRVLDMHQRAAEQLQNPPV